MGPLSVATTTGLSGPGSDCNKGVFCIPSNPSITGILPLDCLVSYQDTHWGVLLLWSYTSHGAQCGVITCHSTCCDYFVRDYHISFPLFALSNPSGPTLCLKDPRRWGWHNSVGSSSDSQVIWVARLSTQRIVKTRCLTTTKNCFHWNTFVRQ